MNTTIQQTTNERDAFRNTLASVDKEGKRKWVYAKKPSGKYYRVRSLLSLLYFALFFGMPFIFVNGRPLFLFDVTKAKFVLFGKLFLPQDFFIMAMATIVFVLFIILFTAAFGRLFCGWACPQTNFMEMMFRKVEYLIEGDAVRQKMLERAPWTARKILIKAGKHFAFFTLSFTIANTFLAYVIGIKQLEHIISEPAVQHIGGLSAILVFSGIFYGVYAFFREQVCTAICPYGRLQSVLLDKNSLVVGYDYKRGEPRGLSRKYEESSFGDCINCLACVKVCPTGIDIRNGVQMECVACTACIDACDNIMESIGKPRGLIRYASENSIEKGQPLRYTARMKVYTVLCVLAVVALSALVLTRQDLDVTVFRTPGILYQEQGADSISNLYNFKFANKTLHPIELSIQVEENKGRVRVIGNQSIHISPEEQGSGSFFVILPKKDIHERKTAVRMMLSEGEKVLTHITTGFLGPVE